MQRASTLPKVWVTKQDIMTTRALVDKCKSVQDLNELRKRLPHNIVV